MFKRRHQNKRLLLSPPHMSGEEQRHIQEAFDANYIAPVGPQLDQFEEVFAEYIDCPYVIAVSSGTAAIHLSLLIAGVQPGDTVLCSSLTFCASANPIRYCGAEPIFIDSDPNTWNIDPNLVEDELKVAAQKGCLPKALIAVDLFGQSIDMDAIEELCNRYDVALIEDAAEALGSSYRGRRLGARGDLNIFSFNGNKLITTSGGGMLCARSEEAIEHARYLATQAREEAAHYQHSEVGFNYRMSNVSACIGIAQVAVIEERVAARQAINRSYHCGLQDIEEISLMPVAAYGKSNCWLTVIQLDAMKCSVTREELRMALESDNIEARPVWKPLHCQPVFKDCMYRRGSVSEEIFARGLCLPSGSAMTEDDVDRVVMSIKQKLCSARRKCA